MHSLCVNASWIYRWCVVMDASLCCHGSQTHGPAESLSHANNYPARNLHALCLSGRQLISVWSRLSLRSLHSWQLAICQHPTSPCCNTTLVYFLHAYETPTCLTTRFAVTLSVYTLIPTVHRAGWRVQFRVLVIEFIPLRKKLFKHDHAWFKWCMMQARPAHSSVWDNFLRSSASTWGDVGFVNLDLTWSSRQIECAL